MKYRADEPHPELWDHLRRKSPSVTHPVSAEQAQHMSETLRARFAEVAHPRTGSRDTQEARRLRREASEGREVLGYCVLCDGKLYTEESAARGMGTKCLKKGLALGIIVRKPDGTFSLVRNKRR